MYVYNILKWYDCIIKWGASGSPHTLPPGVAQPQVDRGEGETGEDCRWGDLDRAGADAGDGDAHAVEHGDGYVCDFDDVNGGG